METEKIFEQFTRAPVGSWRIFGKLSSWKAACAVCLLCAALQSVPSAQTFTTLANFDGSNGQVSKAALVQGRDGDFYGTTYFGGAHGYGTVFKITPGGTLTTLHSFEGNDGQNPQAGLLLATDGNFYGTTIYGGGACDCGTVFKITPAGTLTVLHSFYGADGGLPFAGLVQATDGNFYGTTGYGGAYGDGTVFRISPAGTLTTLHSFDYYTDGSTPYAGLVQATDRSFYGTTANGWMTYGTVFRISPAGTLTTLHSFVCCHDGMAPHAGLVQAIDRSFYGTTITSGAHDFGTVFKITAAGTVTVLHSFVGGPDDGAAPYAGLVQATDRSFYGTTEIGGDLGCNAAGYGCGTVFKITPAGSLTTLHRLHDTDGGEPLGGLVQATDGSFYGTTSSGGAYGDGTVFRVDIGLGPFVTFVRSSGRVRQKVEILGQGFTGTTAVSFNGTPATFRVLSDTFLGAIVPAGATTGYVTVTTPSGTLTSNVRFRVHK